MSSKHKSKEVKSSKKDPEKEKEKEKKKEKKKEKSKEKESNKDKTKKEKKQVISLSVTLYQLEYRNLHHWVLYLNIHNYVYQVCGKPMDFTASVTARAVPRNSAWYIESVKVAEIQPGDIAELDRLICATLVQNDVQGWCCQDYVMEALKALNEEQIVEDEDYERARRCLLRKFNHWKLILAGLGVYSEGLGERSGKNLQGYLIPLITSDRLQAWVGIVYGIESLSISEYHVTYKHILTPCIAVILYNFCQQV
jgi:hypothetical protein